MQIDKINENQIKVVLFLDDLAKNNIKLHSFMCNSMESQNLFSSILNYINSKIGFSLDNCKILVDSFCVLEKNCFILIITRVRKALCPYVFKSLPHKYNANKSFWLRFDNFEDLCMFSDSSKNRFHINSTLFSFGKHYFLHIKVLKLKEFFRILRIASEFTNYIYSNDFLPDENSKLIIKDCAIQMCNKYFS